VGKTSVNWLADSVHQLHLAKCEAMSLGTGTDLDVAVSVQYSTDFDEVMQWRGVLHLGSDVMSGMTPDCYQQLTTSLIDTGYDQLLEPCEEVKHNCCCACIHIQVGSCRRLQKLIKQI
jgi:hypothetical protein